MTLFWEAHHVYSCFYKRVFFPPHVQTICLDKANGNNFQNMTVKLFIKSQSYLSARGSAGANTDADGVISALSLNVEFNVSTE